MKRNTNAQLRQRDTIASTVVVSKRQGYLLSSVLILIALSSGAQVVTLEEAIEVVSRQNPMLTPFETRAQALSISAEGAKSWMAPMVGVGTFMTPYPGQEVMDMDKGSVMVSVEQQIPSAGRLNATSKYLASQANIQRAARLRQLNLLRTETRMTYFRWLVSEKRRGVLKEDLQHLELMQKLAEVRYPYNQGSLGEIYKLTGKIAEANNKIDLNESDIREARSRLLSLMNLPDNNSLLIDTTTVIAPATLSDSAGLYARRSDILELNQRIHATELGRSAQLAQGKPEIKLRFDHMQPLGDGMPKQFTAMAMVSIPIAPWSSRMYKSEARAMEYDIQAMKEERVAIMNEYSGRLTGMSHKLQAMQKQLLGYRQSILPALEKNFQTTLLAYEENRAQLTMVLDGWEALNMMEFAYFEKLESYYTLIADYEKELEL